MPYQKRSQNTKVTKRKPNPAVFLDRDGVLNEVEVDWSIPKSFAPKDPEKLKLYNGVGPALKKIKGQGFIVVVVSNQPDIALGKIDESTKRKLEERFVKLISQHQVPVDGIYYCNHHPSSTNSSYRAKCECRKPKTGMFTTAADEYGIDLGKSWMIGDTWSDIGAGESAGCRTILIAKPWSEENKCTPDFKVSNLYEAVDLIMQTNTI